MADALDRKKMLNEIMSMVRKKNRNSTGGGGQFQLKPTSTISATQPTSAETQADTNRMELDRKYGSNDATSRYYKDRWRTPGQQDARALQQKNVATAAQEAAEFDLKRQKNTREEALAKWKMAGGDGLGLDSVGGGKQQAGARTTGGSPIAAQQTPGTAQVPAQPPVINPSAFPAPDTPMTALQPGTGGIRIPEGANKYVGKPGYYGMNQQGAIQFTPGAPGAPAVAPAATPSRMDSGMMDNFPAPTAGPAQPKSPAKEATKVARSNLSKKPSIDLSKGLDFFRPDKRSKPSGYNPQPLSEAIKTLPRNKKMDAQMQWILNKLKGKTVGAGKTIDLW